MQYGRGTGREACRQSPRLKGLQLFAPPSDFSFAVFLPAWNCHVVDPMSEII